MKPRKKLSQNFLVSEYHARKIVSYAELEKGETVLEIGPGKGMLTGFLLEVADSVLAVEKDRDLASLLRARYTTKKLSVISCDFLKKELDLPDSFKVVANLPYNVATAIFFKLVRLRAHTPRMVLMFQKEVGDRITAKTGTRDYGALSIVARYVYDIRQSMTLKPGLFFPKPKVDSAVLVFKPKPRLPFELDNDRLDKVESLAKKCFMHRRKKLINGLKLLNRDVPENEFLKLLESCGISPDVRPQDVKPESYVKLALQSGGIFES